jgi:hypothetical protein
MTLQHNAAAANLLAETPYVVSADIRLLLMKWATDSSYTLPSIAFFNELRQDFGAEMRRMFSSFVMIEESELRHKISGITGSVRIPTIRMDQVFCGGEYDLHLCRYTDAATGEIVGVTNRPGSPSVPEQIARIAARLGCGRVALADDIIFSGKLLRDVIDDLDDAGITVETVIAGIGIGEGVARLKKDVPDIRCGFEFPNVIDQVCERDFYAGVPLSGRLVAGSDNVGMPYLLPFGDPVKWGSIPQEYAESFSKNCVRRSVELFREIGRVSGRDVLYRDVPRKLIKPESWSEETIPFTHFLEGV